MSDAIEAATNAIVGMIVSYAMTMLVLGFSPTQSACLWLAKSHKEKDANSHNRRERR
jgi:hypothetical protein